MQSIYPLTAAIFKEKTKTPVSKLEITIGDLADTIDLCDFYGKNRMVEFHYSSGQAELTYEPIAAEFTAIIDDADGLLNPKNTDSPFYSFLKEGEQITFSTGFRIDGIDHLWQWIKGVISSIEIDRSRKQIILKGFDFTQYLQEVNLKSPNNYWGSSVTKSTEAGKFLYDLPAGCNGVYIAYLNGSPIYDQDTWLYDRASNKFCFFPSKDPGNGADNLIIYYYTDQIPENVVADLLVTAGRYPTQAAALADMDYTATGITIERVRFEAGTSVFNAIKKMCERCDYHFYFKQDTTPVFKPIPEKDTWENRLFDFDENLVGKEEGFKYLENIDEVRNHIAIKGEEYTVWDDLYRILEGAEIMHTLDDVPDGASYGRVALTSISAGKIIIAGLDAEVTDQMFTNPQAKVNIEAWMHAGDTTLIDGGKIYTNTIVVAGLASAVTDRMFTDLTTKTNMEAWRHASDVTLIDGGDIYAHSVTIDKLVVGGFGSGNQLNNGNFEDWAAGTDVPPDAWAWWVQDGGAVARHGAIKLGTYCVRITRNGTDCSLYQSIHAEKGINYWKGQTVTFSCWAHATAANMARLSVYDGVGESYSSYHTGDSTERLLTVTHTISASATVLYVKLHCDTSNTAVYYDGAMFVEGSYALPYADRIKNFGHPSDYTLIDGGKIYTGTIDTTKLLISDSGNTDEKLIIYQGTSVVELMDYKATNVDHQITNWTPWIMETNTFFSQRIADPDKGGLWICALADGSVWATYAVYAFMNADADTTKDGSASAVIVEEPLRGDPVNHTYGKWNQDANIWGIRTIPYGTSERMVFFVDEDGDFFYDGSGTAYQDEDDIQLIKDTEDILTDKISKSEMRKKDVFKKHKIVHVSEVYDDYLKKNRLDRYVSGKKIQMLSIGAIRQLNDKILALEDKIKKLEAEYERA